MMVKSFAKLSIVLLNLLYYCFVNVQSFQLSKNINNNNYINHNVHQLTVSKQLSSNNIKWKHSIDCSTKTNRRHQSQLQYQYQHQYQHQFVLKSSNNDNDKEDLKSNNDEDENDSKDGGGGMAFFKRMANRFSNIGNENNNNKISSLESVSTTVMTVEKPKVDNNNNDLDIVATKKVVQEKELTPLEFATKLRADAERVRLEAERMDAELTLKKISKLEREIQKSIVSTSTSDTDSTLVASTTGTTTTTTTKVLSTETIEQMQREMEALRAKLRGETPKPILISKPTTKTTVSSASTSSAADDDVQDNMSSTSTLQQKMKRLPGQVTPYTTAVGIGFNESRLSTIVAPFTQQTYDVNYEFVKKLPSYLQKALVLASFGSASTTSKSSSSSSSDDPLSSTAIINDGEVNVTQLAIRIDMMDRLDFSFTKEPLPLFSTEQIEKKKIELLQDEKSWFKTLILNPFIEEERKSGLLKNNDTDYAICVLEYEYYSNIHFVELNDFDILSSVTNANGISSSIGGMNNNNMELMNQFTQIAKEGRKDMVIEQWFPKCTRDETKNNGIGSTIPTLQQVQILISDILPKVSFSCTTKPEKVIGGYIIRGTLKTRSSSSNDDTSNQNKKVGDEFVEKVNEMLQQRKLDDKMTVLYTQDFTIFSRDPNEIEDVVSFNDVDPILYITAANIVRESKPIQLSFVSAFGIASTWYLSLYPFLLNPIIAKRVDEQISLADANMTPDLSFLTDYSFPLFTTYVSIQLIHEISHLIVASVNNMKTSAPTFVPSVITGITSSVTTFRTIPKNLASMFDYSISGPIGGMIASIITVVIGAQMTLYAPDTTLFPSLPIEILRQSSLGGGIIETILGSGALNVPEAALGTPAVAGMTVPLHPIAIAGYISLVVNALSLLPVGTTDGGRVALALFGRGTKLILGQFTMIGLLALGVLGSDLFLFYFAFVIAFQTGNEVPAQNEVDPIDFPRAMLATAAYVLAILALVPF